MNRGLTTIKDFECWANAERIPMILGVDPESFSIGLAYFKRDEERVLQKLHHYLPAGIGVNHLVVPDRIGYDQQSLIDYKEDR